ncbi:XdhC family protein [Saccharopolyspora rosea]|uniref:XdhC family protein n=1 Tax=Saccharopolyspora rosea TaxID=524884 RepID=UPI0021D91D48|nr:XdhC/CoxI family protein [Saccharopolyspora rosea]
MRDIAEQLLEWADEGEPFAVASVVGVRGSAPRGPGAAMAVRADGAVLGSLSGGCIEGAVHDAALEVLADGEPVRHTFDYDPDDPFAVGLTCGGVIDVHIRRCDPRRDTALVGALRSARDGDPVAVARELRTGAVLAVRADRVEGGTGDADLDARVASEARAMLAQGTTGLREICTGGGTRDHDVFVESWTTPPRMLVFGAIDYAAALARIGKYLGYHVTVCDARAVFATPARFPDADEVVVQWPHKYLADCDVDERTAICVLTHDAKFDVPVLQEALRGPAGYVGALGSRRTHADRLRRLRDAGLGDAELSRLRSPIGLDLRASTPEETAVSIAAEIIALRTGAPALPLTHTEGPIHVPT